ncbi:MAG: hypothetical protein CM1200mP2_24050 [Planctomycetaceae bacterium]|nr:MAG: hypothetical protein CM1200mP2_24050 [Planctomycetaceae bacterium]
MVLGLGIENAAERSLSHQVDYHMWASMGGMLFTTLVHGLVMTYFIGTGRWFEEPTGSTRFPETDTQPAGN